MANLDKPKYTIVQHSGYGYAEKPGFARGLEVRTIYTVGELRTVQKADGLLFDSWSDADDYTEDEKIVGSGMYPQAKGSFSRYKIDGLKIYQPDGPAGKRNG